MCWGGFDYGFERYVLLGRASFYGYTYIISSGGIEQISENRIPGLHRIKKSRKTSDTITLFSSIDLLKAPSREI